jgi:hypothetical protein
MHATRRGAPGRQTPAGRTRLIEASRVPGRAGPDRCGAGQPVFDRYRAGARRSTRRRDEAGGDWSTVAMAGESSGPFDAGEPETCARCEEHREALADPVGRLEAAVEAVRERRVDELSEAELSRELAAIDRARRQLEARSTRVAGVLAQRRTRRAMDADRAAGRSGDASRAAKRAKRQLRNELTGQFDWTPAEAKRAVELGDELGSQTSSETRDAFDAGELSARHASLLADTLRWFDDPTERAEVEALLLEAARRQHPVAFGRTCRQLLAERDHDAAMTAERRRHARRAMSVWQTEDGMIAFRGQVAGVAGELLQTGLHAFRRPDAPGEHRRAEQATADAFIAMIRAALDAGKAPTTRAVRPHVTVRLDWQTIAKQAGVAHSRWSGPLPFGDILALLADCGVSRLLTDARSVPMEAGVEVRTVPIGTARAVAARDLTCIADGCDVPAEWCQMMHLATPYRLGGRLTPATAALGCPHHHHLFDRKGWVVTWVDDGARPILHHPDRPPGSHRNPPPATASPQGPDATSTPRADVPDKGRGDVPRPGPRPGTRTTGATAGQTDDRHAGDHRPAAGEQRIVADEHRPATDDHRSVAYDRRHVDPSVARHPTAGQTSLSFAAPGDDRIAEDPRPPP